MFAVELKRPLLYKHSLYTIDLTVYCVLLCSSEETRLKQEEQPMWSTRTYLTPRTLVTICQVSTSATATWWCSTTTQTEYVSAVLFLFVMITSKYTVLVNYSFHYLSL